MSIIKMAKRSKKATPIAKPITSAFLLTLVTAYPIFYLLPLAKSEQSLLSILLCCNAFVFSVTYLSGKLTETKKTKSRRSRSKNKNVKNSSPRERQDFDSAREEGVVKWFNSRKGFGFITRGSGEDIFVHFRSILGEGHRTLEDGQTVEFSISEGSKGLHAEDVEPF